MQQTKDIAKPIVSKIKSLASMDRNRFKNGEFDLDLTYVTKNIIAMTTPGVKTDTITRNSLDEVARFLDHFHKDHYMVWNLSPDKYDYKKLQNKVMEYPIPEAHSPSLDSLLGILRAIDSWLKTDPENVAVIQSNCGRGRAGTIIASYLLFAGTFTDFVEGLAYFAGMRSIKRIGVTTPSQRRYVYYAGECIRGKRPGRQALALQKVLMLPRPRYDSDYGVSPFIEVISVADTRKVILTTEHQAIRTFTKEDPCVALDVNCPVQGDILLRFSHKGMFGSLATAVYMFRLSFNVDFVRNYRLDFISSDLDGDDQQLVDSRFGPDFKVALFFRPDDSPSGGVDATDVESEPVEEADDFSADL